MSSIKDSKSICNNLAANFINFSQQNYFNLPIYICIYIKLNTLTLNYYSFIYLFFFSLSSSALNPKGLNYYIEKRRPRRPRRPHHHCHHGSTTPHHTTNSLTPPPKLFSLSVCHYHFPSSFIATPSQTYSYHHHH